MTADTNAQRNASGPQTTSSALPLTFAALTVLFALFSLILGNRFTTLQSDHLNVLSETATSEATSVEQMKAAFETAKVNLEAAQQALAAEKAAANRLRKQIGVITNDLETARADLAKAKQAITELKPTELVKPLPASVPSDPATQPAVPSSVESDVMQKPPAPIEPQQPPLPAPSAATMPKPSGAQPAESQAKTPETQAGKTAPSTTSPAAD